MRKISAANMLETTTRLMSGMTPVQKIQKSRANFVRSWRSMTKVFYYIFQGTKENVVSARLSDTKYSQRSDFTAATAAAKTAAAVTGQATTDGTGKGKVFFVKNIGTGDTSYVPFANFDKTRRYTDGGQFSAGVNPRWFDSTNLAEKAAVLIVFRHMLVDIIMWNEAIIRGHSAIPERFRTLYLRQWQRVPRERIDEAEDEGQGDLVDEYERRNRMIDVHDQYVKVLQEQPNFFSLLEREISRRDFAGPSLTILIAFTQPMLDYCLQTFQALDRVRNVYVRPPRDSSDPREYSARMALNFHQDKAQAAGVALLLADIYQNWTLTFETGTGLSPAVMNSLGTFLVGLANFVASDKEKKRVIAERIPFFVFFLELYDSEEFDLKNAALMRFRDTPNPVPKDIKKFVHEFALQIFSRADIIDFYNSRSSVAQAGYRYRLKQEQAEDILNVLHKIDGLD